MHDLKVERFYKTQTINGLVATKQGPIKTFPLRGIKESPPYFHDGRLLTLEDTVEFFNLILETKLTPRRRRRPGGVPAAAVRGARAAVLEARRPGTRAGLASPPFQTRPRGPADQFELIRVPFSSPEANAAPSHLFSGGIQMVTACCLLCRRHLLMLVAARSGAASNSSL